MPVIFRIRTLPAKLNRADFARLIAVSWRYEVHDSGMRSPEERDRMDLFEDLLTPVLETPENAILTVVVTGNGVREWQWYSRSDVETMELVNSALAGQDPFPVEFVVQDDPNWEAYTRFKM